LRLAFRRRAGDQLRDQLTLHRQRLLACGDQSAPELVQHQGPGDQDRQAEQIEDDDEPP
jgi:hypothetical protein